MRKLLCALSLISALVFALAVQAAAPTNFAGTWTLDKSKSQGLNQRIQNAESVSWTITQDEKTISIEEKVTGGGGPGGGGGAAPSGAAPSGAPPAGGTPPAGGAPAGGGGGGQGGGQGGGRGMGGGMGGPRTFNLDGTEVSGETQRGKFVRKATWSSDGKTLDLTSKTTFMRQDTEITATSTDKLTLSADGKALTVTRKIESPQGAQESTWVLTKN